MNTLAWANNALPEPAHLVPVNAAAGHVSRFTGLIDDVRMYAAAARSQRTREAYASDFKQFARFCQLSGLGAMPATSQTVALYIAHLARVAKVATIRRHLVSISQAHKARGLDSPTTHRIVREAMKGIARTLGTAQDRKEPLRPTDLREIADGLPATIKGARDRALLLLGFAGAFRRSELVALTVEDVTQQREGLVVTIRRSKTDQEARGHEIGIPFGSNPATCPVRALEEWLQRADIRTGFIFRPVAKGGRIGRLPLSGEAVAQIVKGVVVPLGYNPARFAGHSLRAGFATAAIEGGATEYDTMRHTRHRSTAVFRGYVRRGSLWKSHAGYSVGL